MSCHCVVVSATKIFVNGCWVGIHRDPEQLMSTLKKLRRQMDIIVSEVFWLWCSILHTHTPVQRPFVRDYPGEPVPEGKTKPDFTEARDSEWQWHQLGHMQICTSLQTDNHISTPPLSFWQAGCPSCRPTNSVKALMLHVAYLLNDIWQWSSFKFSFFVLLSQFWPFL